MEQVLRGVKAGLAQRARIVLLAGEEAPSTEIAGRVGVPRPTVALWRERYARRARGAGRPAALGPAAARGRGTGRGGHLGAAARGLGVTHWSCRLLGACFERHRHSEFLRFLERVAKAYPRRELHVVLDNYGTHKHPAVRDWLAKNSRIHLHFTPTSGSWLNLVEIFFGITTRQAVRRGTFGSVPDSVAAIRRFINGWNERCGRSPGARLPRRCSSTRGPKA